MGEHDIRQTQKTPTPARIPAAVLPVLGLVAVLVACLVAGNGISWKGVKIFRTQRSQDEIKDAQLS
jgi:hypothetical protein